MTDYWIGPFDVRVPTSCYVVPQPDGNCHDKKNSVTEVCYFRPSLTEQQYKDKYCIFRDGYWWINNSPACQACGFKGWSAEGRRLT